MNDAKFNKLCEELKGLSESVINGLNYSVDYSPYDNDNDYVGHRTYNSTLEEIGKSFRAFQEAVEKIQNEVEPDES